MAIHAGIETVDPDKVLAVIGSRCYQMFVMLIIAMVWCFMGFQAMSRAFIGLYHPFTCDVAEFTNRSYFEYIYDSACTTRTNKTCLVDENATLLFDPGFGTTLQSEYHLVCGDYYIAQFGSTMYTVGGLISNVVIAQISDSFGRKWTLLVFWWASVALTLLRVVLPNYMSEMICYVALGATTTGVTSIGWVLSCEMVAPKLRGPAVSLICNMVWISGYMLQGVAVLIIPDWRPMIFWTNVPFVLTLGLVWVIPESLHWLVAEKKWSDADAWIKKLGKANCVEIDISECQKDEKEEMAQPAVTSQHTPRRTVFDVLFNPVLMFHGLICCFMGMVGMLTYWGLSLFSTQMSDDRFTGYFLSGLIEIPAGIMAPLLLIKVNRKHLTAAGLALTTAGFIGRSLLPDDASSWLGMCLFLLAKYGNMIFWPGAFLLQSEIFPTTVRNLGFGLMGMLGSFGNMSAPFLGDFLAKQPVQGSILFASMNAACCFMVFGLPETKDCQLPEDIGDEPLGPFLALFCKNSGRPKNLTKLTDAPAQNQKYAVEQSEELLGKGTWQESQVLGTNKNTKWA